MTEPSLQLGNGNWAGKSGNLLAYHKSNNNFYADDLTFARASTGTYTDKDGYIQEMPYNLLQQSNQFDTTWTKDNTTLTSGQSGYDGSSDAWKLTKSSNQYAKLIQAVSISDEVTYSFYIKADSLNYAIIYIDASTDVAIWVDLTNGTITNTLRDDLVTNKQVESLQNGWYRCSISTNQVVSHIRIFPNDTSTTYGITSGSIYIQDAQLNKGTSAKTYFPTTTRLNIPRVDYLNNSNGSLILEPQTQNLVTYSEDFSQWSTLSANAATYVSDLVNPDGSVGGYKISGDGVYLGIGLLTTTQRSIYARSVSGSGNVQLLSHNSNGGLATFTLTEEWQRFDSNSSPFVAGNFYIDLRGASSTLSELYVWGAQATNDQSYVTSYIPTSGSSVTRNQDACSISNVADRIGQTEGTIYGEFNFKDHSTGTRRLLCLTDGSSSNRITTYLNTLNKLSVYIVNGGAAQADIQATILTEGIIKYAVAYANNSIKLYLNGTQVGTDTSATIPATTDLYVGSENGNNPSFFDWNQVTLFDQALTDTELATLTT